MELVSDHGLRCFAVITVLFMEPCKNKSFFLVDNRNLCVKVVGVLLALVFISSRHGSELFVRVGVL